ncbi:H2O-forming NADH oxidase [Oceanivirga salmonicida]|uniref:H2O-forming NADH oxidase n=1 Tax=Oceanivirga salmonicida TaxID=1769291 RepID=UPI0012E10189|nr:FAD-dependent oxidoreductase [Oceanivirga salmonicida]
MKVVLVGANHAGTAAINTILDNYKGIEVTVFDKNSNISFLGCGMALWIGNQISTPDGLFYSDKPTLESKGAKVYMETEVTKIDTDNKIVYAQSLDGKKYEEKYDKLILSTGSLPLNPPIPGKDLENVQFVKLFQDAKEVIEKIESKDIKHVTVVGAGYIGVELAEAFKRNGKDVSLIDSSDSVLCSYYDEEFRNEMGNVLSSNGVELLFNQKVETILGNQKVEGVKTDKNEFKTDMVVLCIGFRPNTDLLKDKLELHQNAYKVNRKQETNIKDVYAIGDCATVYDNSIDDINYIALATNAVRSGILAAHNACGTELVSPGVQGSNGISIYDYNMVSTGLTEEAAKRLGMEVLSTSFEDVQKADFIENSPNEKVKIKIVYEKGSRRIVGAQIASKHDVSMGIHLFSLAIQEKLTIDKLKLLDIFFLPHFNKPYNYITMAALGAK